jgi:hypothetical protein
MHNLGTILYVPFSPISTARAYTDQAIRKRLEGMPSLPWYILTELTDPAVTSRLEDVAVSHTSTGAQTMRSPTMAGHDILAGTSAPNQAVPPADNTPAAPQVQAYHDLISGPLADYISKSEALGGVVAQHVGSWPV